MSRAAFQSGKDGTSMRVIERIIGAILEFFWND